jgi:hypothetical protein
VGNRVVILRYAPVSLGGPLKDIPGRLARRAAGKRTDLAASRRGVACLLGLPPRGIDGCFLHGISPPDNMGDEAPRGRSMCTSTWCARPSGQTNTPSDSSRDPTRAPHSRHGDRPMYARATKPRRRWPSTRSRSSSSPRRVNEVARIRPFGMALADPVTNQRQRAVHRVTRLQRRALAADPGTSD